MMFKIVLVLILQIFSYESDKTNLLRKNPFRKPFNASLGFTSDFTALRAC